MGLSRNVVSPILSDNKVTFTTKGSLSYSSSRRSSNRLSSFDPLLHSPWAQDHDQINRPLNRNGNFKAYLVNLKLENGNCTLEDVYKYDTSSANNRWSSLMYTSNMPSNFALWLLLDCQKARKFWCGWAKTEIQF